MGTTVLHEVSVIRLTGKYLTLRESHHGSCVVSALRRTSRASFLELKTTTPTLPDFLLLVQFSFRSGLEATSVCDFSRTGAK
ncbi:hypothetical protein J6590_081455 [Homalodisca vitripennis]|nr:hypothetical protein J6590_081455 [Homalodisca vitripennis]